MTKGDGRKLNTRRKELPRKPRVAVSQGERRPPHPARLPPLPPRCQAFPVPPALFTLCQHWEGIYLSSGAPCSGCCTSPTQSRAVASPGWIPVIDGRHKIMRNKPQLATTPQGPCEKVASQEIGLSDPKVSRDSLLSARHSRGKFTSTETARCA